MRNAMGKIALVCLIAVMLLLILPTTTRAANGTENVTLSRYSANILPGGNVSVNYSLGLVSGYYSFGTTMYVKNNEQLISNGIDVLLSRDFGNPPINGTMHIYLAHNITPGNYRVTLSGNSTQVGVNPGTISLSVGFNTTTYSSSMTTVATTVITSVSSSIVSTIAQNTNHSIVPSTIAQVSTAAKSSGAAYYIVAIAIIAAILVWLVYFKKKPTKTKK